MSARRHLGGEFGRSRCGWVERLNPFRADNRARVFQLLDLPSPMSVVCRWDIPKYTALRLRRSRRRRVPPMWRPMDGTEAGEGGGGGELADGEILGSWSSTLVV